MKASISNNANNVKFLRDLLENDFYTGVVKPDFFEVKRNSYGTYFTVKGIANTNGSFDLMFDHDFPSHKLVLRSILGILITFSLPLIFHGYWFIVLIDIASWIIIYFKFEYEKRKEYNLLIDKLLELSIRNEKRI